MSRFSSILILESGQKLKITPTATNYSVTNNDYIVSVTNTSSSRTIILPSASTNPNQIFIIKDASGGAGSNNIIVSTSGGNIDGETTHIISQNYGSYSYISDGTNYLIV